MYKKVTISLIGIAILLISFHSSIAQTVTEEIEKQYKEYLPLIKSASPDQANTQRTTTSESVKVETPQQEPSATLYTKMERLAETGDPKAIFHLDRVNRYLQQRDALIPPQEVEIGFKTVINGTNIIVRGLEPYYLKLYNEPSLETLADLQNYIDVRQQVLKQLDDENLLDVVEISVSFDGYIDLMKLWELKSTYKIDIDAMTVHLVVDDQWHSVMYFSDPVEIDDKTYIDFETSVEDFIEQIQTSIADSEGPPDSDKNSNSLLSDISQVTFMTDWIRAKVTIENAQSLSVADDVMLVDAISDFSSRYSERALDVIVVDVPNLHAKREVLRTQEE